MGGRTGYRGGFDSVLTLYRPLGSWFEEDRLHRLAYDDKSKANPRPNPRIETRVGQPGLYLLEVGSFYNLGGAEYAYQLRVIPNGPAATEQSPTTANGSGPEPWQERTFSRPIRPDHIRRILARTVESGNGVGAASAGNGTPPQEERAVPAGRPPTRQSGSRNPTTTATRPRWRLFLSWWRAPSTNRATLTGWFPSGPARPEARFRAGDPRGEPARLQPSVGRCGRSRPGSAEQRLPASGSPGPLLQQDHRTQDDSYLPAGRDLHLAGPRHHPAKRGGDFRYRLLVRPQIPHAGELKVQEDRLNLIPGEAGKLTVTTGQEEGFSGQILLQVEGLPPGVQALPGTDYRPETPPNLDEGPKARYMPQQGATSIMIVAAADAPATRMPRVLRIRARPVVSGKMGEFLPVGRVHLMVLQGNRPQAAAKSP